MSAGDEDPPLPPDGPGPGPTGAEEERWALAGEYVLGVLPADERAWVEQARAGDAALDAEIAGWEERLHPLSRLAPEVAPDPGLWARIAASLDAPTAATASPQVAPAAARAASPRQAPPALAAPASRPSARPPRPGRLARMEAGLWSSLAFWRTTGLAAAAAAVLLAVLAGRPPGPPALPSPLALAVLEGKESQNPGWIVEVHANGTLRILPLTREALPAGRALELWTLRDPAEGPRSLGVVGPHGDPSRATDALGPVQQGQLFEISLEPATGSPTGRPTGPVLFIGRATAL